MRTHKNYVRCLGKMDHRREAWKTSRPMFSEEELNFDKVAQMDLSLNSMLVFTFEIRSSALFRDLIFSLRPMEGWALSTRSMPISPDTVRLSSEFDDRDDEYAKIIKMFDLLDAGYSRDQAREVLPMSVSSTYTFTIDFRVLCSFCRTIEALNHDLFNEYCLPMLNTADVVQEYTKSTVRPSYEYYAIDETERVFGVSQTGNMVFGHYTMKLAMASQFLRQHYSKIKTGLWNGVTDYYNLDLDQKDRMEMAYYIDANSYHRLMAMRSHWVIDWSMDMWGGMVGDYISTMSPQEFWEFTPAGGGKPDPYWADVYNRVLLTDPGVPCPIMTEWPAALEHRRKEIGDNPILDMYDKLFEKGFIKDNPENEHRQKFLSLVKQQGGMNDGYYKEVH